MANTKGMTPNEIGRSDKKMMDKLEQVQIDKNAWDAVRASDKKNMAVAKEKEAKKDYEIFGSRGDAARTGMEEGKMNAAGDTYKKGGVVKCKIDGIAVRGKTKAK